MILGFDGRLANAAQPAGAGHYCREVLRALCAKDHELKLRVYLDAPPRDSMPDNLDCAEVRVLPSGPFWTHRILARELRRDTPDVFFTPVPQVPWRCPCPTLVSVLDLAAWTHPASFPWRKRMSMKLQAGRAIRRADHFIAISQTTADDLTRRFGVAASRIDVARLGCSARFFEASQPEPGTLLETLPERFVLYVGQIQPRKNLARLMEAFARVMASHPELPHHFVVAGGGGWQNDDIHRAAATSPVAGRIHFLDYVSDDLLPALMARADVLALVSLWEGFGLPALEAMAAGTAVLASDCSSLPEVVGDAGVLVDPEDTDAIADGLARLLTDDALRARCEERGRDRARLFCWEDTARVIAKAARGLSGRSRAGQSSPRRRR